MPTPTITTHDQPARRPETTTDRLFRLDSIGNPGLSEKGFRDLIVTCPCGLTMTCRELQWDNGVSGSPSTVLVIADGCGISSLCLRFAEPKVFVAQTRGLHEMHA